MMRRPRLVKTLAVLATIPGALLAAGPAVAQAGTDAWLARCQEYGDRDRSEAHCEVRNYELAATGSLEVQASPNGGISVVGWDGDQVQVVAKVRAQGRTMDDARELAREIRVIAEPGSIRTDGPRPQRGSNWSVSYEVRVPNRTNLALESTNGGLHVEDVSGELRLRTTNGGISLAGVSGDVRGRTVNGGVDVELEGRSWTGRGLEIETTNGGVTLQVPSDYSAELRASTVNGGLDVDFPITVQGRIGRRIEATLGSDGAPIRIQTTNGGVTLRRW